MLRERTEMRNNPTVVALHQSCKVPYRLSKLHYIDFCNTAYDQSLARVIATLNTMV